VSIHSRYEIIWRQLKQNTDHKVTLAAPAEAHFRLRRAVIKRKDIDLGFKVMMAEKHLRPCLRFKSKGNILTVELHFPLAWNFL